MITGLTEPRQDTPGRIAEFRLFNRRSQVYIVNPTMDSGSSVERLSFGSVSSVVSSAKSPRLWFVPVISVSAH